MDGPDTIIAFVTGLVHVFFVVRSFRQLRGGRSFLAGRAGIDRVGRKKAPACGALVQYAWRKRCQQYFRYEKEEIF
jgi:hypothetical protein